MKLKLQPFQLFLLTFIVLLSLWLTFYQQIYAFSPQSQYQPGIERSISIVLAKNANSLLGIFGFDTELLLDDNTIVATRITNFQDSHGTWIGEACNGLKLMGIFACFIISYGKFNYKKIIFIIAGIVLIHFTNVIRVAGLTYIEAIYPEYLDFNHNVTFQVIIYSVIFGLWWVWINKFNKDGFLSKK